ncbi:DNA repair protein RecO [Pseudomonas matsuisoli]|uniref:DNA repair protein RecO n=1 Tax=Pseudomonas matsuisoli TaxID=1515666 RepID=A0A917PKD9_9PSED|nr:DNA repair protein RecO [Pseudomonas matsuisoli]GGJ82193.1 DNA repair protein RecO [Pseudomonas matsuisoli]
MHAYVLHSRPYKESSALVDLFSEQGRCRAVLRNARGRAGGLARPFLPLEIELRGRTELKSVARLEAVGIPHILNGDLLFSGLYLNELIVRLLPADDPHPALYLHYAATLAALAEGRALQPLLRAFEWRLLDELGYGFSLTHDTQGNSIQPAGLYRFRTEDGLEPIGGLEPGAFHGRDICLLAQADWESPGALAAAKRLMRQALAPHLGGKPLISRELFINRKEPIRD